MNNIELINQLNSIGAIKTGIFTLKSGITSPVYIDLRQIVSFPNLLNMLSETLWMSVNNLEFELMCGVPYTALPIATVMSVSHNVPMVMRRKESKEYGTKKKIEGVFKPEQRCLIVEDVITSGSSILETVDDLRSVGLRVNHVVTAIDREQGGRDNLQKHGLTLTSLLNLSAILNHLAINI